MKRPYLSVLGIAIVLMAIGLIFTSYKSSKKYRFGKSAEELHSELIRSKHFIDPNSALKIIQENNEDYIFVDIRNPREYANFHIDGAVNLPMQRALDDENIPYLKDDRKKVLYSDESIKADQLRVLLTQYGYKNLYVLQGGAKYWRENMLKIDYFKAKAEYDDEKLKFDPQKIKASN